MVHLAVPGGLAPGRPCMRGGKWSGRAPAHRRARVKVRLAGIAPADLVSAARIIGRDIVGVQAGV